MSSARSESLLTQSNSGAVAVYCFTSLVIEEAHRQGLKDFAQSLETSLASLLETLPREQQSEALRLSYEMAIAGEASQKPRLRLVHSRD